MKTFEGGGDWCVVAKRNDVKYQTAYHWVHADEFRYERLPRSGTRSKILDDMEIAIMLTWLGEDPAVKLELLRPRVKAEFVKYAS